MVLCAPLCAMGVCAQEKCVLTLEELFALADKNSKSLHAASFAVREAEQAVEVAKNGKLPDIDISLSASYLGNGYLTDRNFSDGRSVSIPHFGNNFAITATQLIYGGGKVDNAIALAHLKKEMAGVNLEATRSRVRWMLTGFYLDLYQYQNALRVYDKSIALAQLVITDTRARNKEGVALQNDVTRQELHLKNLELARKRVANSAEILNYDLVTLLGLPAGTQIQVDSTLIARQLPTESLAHWQEVASTGAHSVKQSALAVKMGVRAEKLERSNLLPNVALVASNHFDGPITIEVPAINKNFNYWFVGVNVSYPLHSLYKSKRSIKQARIATEWNRYKQEETLQQTNLNVMADYTRMLEAQDAVETLKKSVTLAHENYDIVSTRYNNDIALVTDLLDAATQRLDAELQLVNARINVLFNYYKLCETAGIL